MGKGDRRTRRGKIWHGTYGKFRLKPSKKRKLARLRAQQAAEGAGETSTGE